MTSRRPADLPEFRAPPLTEVALGAQFDVIPGFLTPHVGLVWQRFRDQFPLLEEQQALPPIFETFGPNPQFGMSLQLVAGPETPRVFFINQARTELLQVQKDRFLHNWRKVGAADSYPRFERMLETFKTGFATFSDAISSEGLGSIIPNQCEVTYINQMPVASGGSLSDITDDLFGQHTGSLALDDLGKPEDLRFLLRYIMRDDDGKPMGRLLASAEPGRRLDGQAIIQLTLTARGRPTTPDENGIVDFLNKGRISVVKGFAHLTGPKMHKLWERTQ
ncbi:TIGR04255 family protein [Bradyrhizobium lupini]|uniref:TIGR04255 family protein n=1 Tax=Rhizobium lupini TaxID=136996 RepID=UPI0034C638E3